MITANSEIISKYGHIFKRQVDEVLPPWVLKNFLITVVKLTETEATFVLAYNPDLYRKIPALNSVKLLSGQAIMALTDTLLIFPVLVQVGQDREIVTLSSNTEFLRPVKAGETLIQAKVIRTGKKVVRGQVEIYDMDDKLCAISTICYIYP